MADFKGVTIGTKEQIDALTLSAEQLYFEVEDVMEVSFDFPCVQGQNYTWSTGEVPEGARLEIAMVYFSGYTRNFTLYNWSPRAEAAVDRPNFRTGMMVYANDNEAQYLKIIIDGGTDTNIIRFNLSYVDPAYNGDLNVYFHARLIKNP